MAPTMNTCWLCTAGGRGGSSGIHQNTALLMASSGAVDAHARQARNSSPALSTGYITAATGTTGPSGWAVMYPVDNAGELYRAWRAWASTAPAQRPKQVGVLGLAGSPQLPVGRHDLHRAQVVAGQPIGAVQPADPPTQRQPGDAGGGDNATGNRQPEGLRLAVDIPPGRPTLHAHSPSAGIDPHATHRRQIQHQPVIADAVTGDAMPPGAHRRQQLLLAGQVDRV